MFPSFWLPLRISDDRDIKKGNGDIALNFICPVKMSLRTHIWASGGTDPALYGDVIFTPQKKKPVWMLWRKL
jgi:hypothetical protein